MIPFIPICSFLVCPIEANNGSLHFGYGHTPIVPLGSKKLHYSWVTKEPSPCPPE